jgi:3D (Asp-Asp-Asp) domain-containing protein
MSVQIRKSVPVLALVAGALAVTLAACGGSSPAPAANKGGNSQQGGGNRGGGAPPGVFGSIAAVSGQTLQVQNPQSGQVAVSYDGSTKITNSVSGALSDVTSGVCVSVVGTSTGQGQPVSATAVTITPAGANGCTFGNGGQRPSGSNSPRPSGSRAPRPSGSNAPRPSTGNNPAGGPRAFGAVTAVSATGFTVHSTFGTNTTDTTVTVTSATTYTKTVAADPSVLVVGACVAAQGKADDTGAVAATSIAVSKAGPNGCTGGFRGGFGGGRGGRGGNGGGSGSGNGGGNG